MSKIASFRDVIKLWRTPDALADEIGASAPAVRKWPQRDRIPPEWWLRVLKTSYARKAGLTAELFAQIAEGERVE
jgi:hypothetical protein